MKAIKINFRKSNNECFGQSKWWGAPDLPEDWEYPEMPDEDGTPLTFICQINCADLAPFDPEGQLPHEGMLYFFAALDEYMMDEGAECPFHNGIGEWDNDAFKVLYTPSTDNLSPYELTWDDGTPAYLPAEAISFEVGEPFSDDFRLLGMPYFQDVQNGYYDYLNLLQIDENDDWGLRLYDCGMINFLIRPEDLKARRFDKAVVYFESL